MQFFETVAGQRFTEHTMPTLINELEKINNRTQSCEKISLNSLSETLSERIKEGLRVVAMIDDGKGCAIVVFEE